MLKTRLQPVQRTTRAGLAGGAQFLNGIKPPEFRRCSIACTALSLPLLLYYSLHTWTTTAVFSSDISTTGVAANVSGVDGGNEFAPRGWPRRDLPGCDLWTGRWIYDSSYPNRSRDSCVIGKSHSTDCKALGKRDEEYMHYRWTPNECQLPRFDPKGFLSMMRGKRVLFVGDSVSYNHHSSLVCLLEAHVSSGKIQSSGCEMYSFDCAVSFLDYNLTLTYLRSQFLVKRLAEDLHSFKLGTLLVTEIDPIFSDRIAANDLIVFNTGLWYFGHILPSYMAIYGNVTETNPELAISMGISSFFGWLNTFDLSEKVVIFKSYTTVLRKDSSSLCDFNFEQPLSTNTLYPFFDLPHLRFQLLDLISKMPEKNRLAYLDVEFLSFLRADAHLGVTNIAKDCSHWCLPGVPDTWNELMYIAVLREIKRKELTW